MGSIIGFSLFDNLEDGAIEKLTLAEKKVLSVVDHLDTKSFTLGSTQLNLWGHADMSANIHALPDGSLLALVGSPHNQVAWKDVQDGLLANEFELPWEGRVILLRISPNGKHWMIWSDWLGSIPTFYAGIGNGRIISTLEPVTVAAAGYTPDDFFLPGLVALLLNGHLISDWTIYDGMKTIPPDSFIEWDEKGFRKKKLWSVKPSRSRWETNWDDLVDEMHELSFKAISETLSTHPKWTLPLSSGMDSRLIAGIAAEVGANVNTYAWGEPNTTDVVYSRQIAQALGLPWKHIHIPEDFMVKYLQSWANCFGSSMHFHGMYQMAFLDQIKEEAPGPVIAGFIGDTLSGDAVNDAMEVHENKKSFRIGSEWYSTWPVDMLENAVKFPIKDALEENALEIKDLIDSYPGALFQKLQFLELWNRQGLFTGFQSVLSSYWRDSAVPYMSREYARFCMSLPRSALDKRRLLADVYRRYYGKLAVIPGTYSQKPFILTGRYLLKRRLFEKLPPAFHLGPFRGFGNVQIRLDVNSIQRTGIDALWPLFEIREKLSKWFKMDKLDDDYQTLMRSQKDIRPLRRLQAVQALAYRLR